MLASSQGRSFYLRIAVITLLICLTAGSAWGDAAGDLFNRADTAYSRRDYSEALALYQRVVNEYPANRLAATSLYYVGRCHEELGNLTAARNAYQNVIDRYGSSSMAEYARRRITEIDARQGAGGAVDRLASMIEETTPAGQSPAASQAVSTPIASGSSSAVTPISSQMNAGRATTWQPAENQGTGQVRMVNGRREYTVIPGDTLSGIAGSLLGDESKYTLIARANGISSPYTIFAGQVLVIPDASGHVPSASQETTYESSGFPEVDAESALPESNTPSSFPNVSGLPSVSASPQSRQSGRSTSFPDVSSAGAQQYQASSATSVSLPRTTAPTQQSQSQQGMTGSITTQAPSQVVVISPQVIPTASLGGVQPQGEPRSSGSSNSGIIEPIAPMISAQSQASGVVPRGEQPTAYVSGDFGRMGAVDLPFEVNVTEEVISQTVATSRYTPPNVQPFHPFTPTIAQPSRSPQQSTAPAFSQTGSLGPGPQPVPQTIGAGPRVEAAVGVLPDGTQLIERRRFLDAHNARAVQYMQLGLFDEAVSEYEMIISAVPEDPVGYNNLAWLLVDEDIDYERAVSLIQEALLLEPPNEGAYLDTMAWAYYKMEKTQLASETILKALAEQETAVRLYHAGVIYSQLGLRSRARGYLEKAIAFSEDADLAREAQAVRDSLSN